jgi:hypothetical protein
MNEKSGENKGERYGDSNKYGAEGHCGLSGTERVEKRVNPFGTKLSLTAFSGIERPLLYIKGGPLHGR